MSSPAGTRVLILEDDKELSQVVSAYLESEGLKVKTATAVEAAMKLVLEWKPSAVVIDINLQGESGLNLVRRLQDRTDIGLLILTGRGDPLDRVLGLELGADDYIVKPVLLRKLLARINSVVRRVERSAAEANEAGGRFGFGTFELDCNARILSDDQGNEIPLTTAEYRLLQAFVTHAGRVLNRDQLLDLARGRKAAHIDRSIDMLVSKLRAKLETDRDHPTLIKTVHGSGYVFTSAVNRLA